MFLSLLATLAVLGQAPASSEAPLSVLTAPPEAPGVSPTIVSFIEDHVAEQLKTQGVLVTNATELAEGLSPTDRREVLGCNRLEAACRITLGEAAQVEVVMIAELREFLSGYRVALKAYTSRDGELLAEYYVPGVREDQLLDAFNRAIDKVLLQVRRTLRPQTVVEADPTLPSTGNRPPEVRPADPNPGVKPPVAVKTLRRSNAPGWAWVPALGGAVALGAGAYCYVQAGQEHERLRTGPFQSPEQANQVRAAGERWQMLTRVSAGVGAAGVVTTGLIYLLSGTTEVVPGVTPTASLTPSGGMIGVRGTLP